MVTIEKLKAQGFIKVMDELMNKPVYKMDDPEPFNYCYEETDGNIICSKGDGDSLKHTPIPPQELYLHYYKKDERPTNIEFISDMPFIPKGRINRVTQNGTFWGVAALEMGLFMDLQIMLNSPTIFKPIYKQSQDGK